jgi:hypothetical protein
MNAVVALPSRDELRQFVRTTLCLQDRLDVIQTPFYEALLTRSRRPCGLYFEIHGPRLVRSCAVWAGDEHRILFYNSMGERFAEVRLSEAPDLAAASTATVHAKPQAA